MAEIEQRLDVLERQMKATRRQVQAIDERVDTVFSPLWLRVWWWLCGYRWFHVGRWYGKTSDLR